MTCHAATVARIVLTAVIVAYLVAYTRMFPWWTTREGRTLALWPALVALMAGNWAAGRIIGAECVTSMSILVGATLMITAATHRLVILLDTRRNQLTKLRKQAKGKQ